MNDKLAGEQLRVFGEFFKKSWRANDVLWGNLDGVNRIVDALVTSQSLKHLPKFLARQGEPPEQSLKKLITETLPAATKAEKTGDFCQLAEIC
ncbi:DUF3376 domain-containing protein [Phormidium tenue FACHB-886]|nr:DUF3376 domain-containing protein [Phormidium tenue FACHB-886]